MPKVSDEYRETKRREIAEAALRAFERKGFKSTSMADIITESGVSAGAIYGSFRSKAEIVQAVASSVVGERLLDGEKLLAVEPVPAPVELIRLMMNGVLTSLKNPTVLLQMWGEAVTDPDLRVVTQEIMIRIEGLYQRHLARWYEQIQGLPSAEAEAKATQLAPLFVSLSQGFIVQSALRDDFDGEQYLAVAAELLPH